MEIGSFHLLGLTHVLRFFLVAQHGPISLKSLICVHLKWLLLLLLPTNLRELLPLTKVGRCRPLVIYVLVMIVLHFATILIF